MIKKYFNFYELDTNYKQEIMAGITTFFTLSNVLIINPKILEIVGIPFGAALVGTIIMAFIGTFAMGIYAKRPFSIAPILGQSAFIAYTVVKVLGYSWNVAIGAIFLSGVLLALLTLFNIRSWLVKSIPVCLRAGFSVGTGLFLTFIGLINTGIIETSSGSSPVHVGHLNQPSVIIALLGFLLMATLMIKKVKAAIFIGISTTTLLAFVFGLISLPHSIVSLPPSILPVLGQLDITGALNIKFIPILMTLMIIVFIDTTVALTSISDKLGILDKKGQLPEIKKPMLCDSFSTILGSFCGTPSVGVYLAAATGIEAGGRSGISAITTAFLFLTALFFAPLLTMIPPFSYGGALIIVGMLMLTAINSVNLEDLTELIPFFCTISLICFTFNVGIGMAAGFIVYPLMKILSGRNKEISLGLWILAAISSLFFILYPY